MFFFFFFCLLASLAARYREFGFLLPAEEIVPTGEEIFAAVVAMGQFIEANP